MLDILAAIGIGSAVGLGARMLKDGVIFNPSDRIQDTLDRVSRENDELVNLGASMWTEEELRSGNVWD